MKGAFLSIALGASASFVGSKAAAQFVVVDPSVNPGVLVETTNPGVLVETTNPGVVVETTGESGQGGDSGETGSVVTTTLPTSDTTSDTTNDTTSDTTNDTTNDTTSDDNEEVVTVTTPEIDTQDNPRDDYPNDDYPDNDTPVVTTTPTDECDPNDPYGGDNSNCPPEENDTPVITTTPTDECDPNDPYGRDNSNCPPEEDEPTYTYTPPEEIPGCPDDNPYCEIINTRTGSKGYKPDKKVVKDVVTVVVDTAAEGGENPLKIDPVEIEIILYDKPEKLTEPPTVDTVEFAKTVSSGLTPRNIDGPSRGMSTYNFLLADTLFERLPLRQYDLYEVVEVIEEESSVEVEQQPEQQPPIRGLWSKTSNLSELDANQYLDGATKSYDLAQAESVSEDDVVLIEFDDETYVEDVSNTARFARRDSVRAWFSAFGGDDRNSHKATKLYNPFYVTSGGGVLGVDVSLSESFQVGGFVNYGKINLYQDNAGVGDGSWSPDGWGGGIRADYWSDNFYLQGVFSATGFEGQQKRKIIEINDEFGNTTADGSKSATGYGLAFRVGSPFESGDFLIEPQFTASWSFNDEQRFSENGAGDLDLSYDSRSTTYFQTDLAVKVAYPIESGERALWIPSLRIGWLGDWSSNLSDQVVGYSFSDREISIDSLNEDTNGLLVEAGLDYSVANVGSTSYKVFVRGGLESWSGERGTDFRASGGVELQF